jgi:hypothetical protein
MQTSACATTNPTGETTTTSQITSQVVNQITFFIHDGKFSLRIESETRHALEERSHFWLTFFGWMDRQKPIQIEENDEKVLLVNQDITFLPPTNPNQVPFEEIITKDHIIAYFDFVKYWWDCKKSEQELNDAIKKTQDPQHLMYLQKEINVLCQSMGSEKYSAFFKMAQIDLELEKLRKNFSEEVQKSFHPVSCNALFYHENLVGLFYELLGIYRTDKYIFRTEEYIRLIKGKFLTILETIKCSDIHFTKLKSLHSKIIELRFEKKSLLEDYEVCHMMELASKFNNALEKYAKNCDEIRKLQQNLLHLIVNDTRHIKNINIPLLTLGIKFDDEQFMDIPIDFTCPFLLGNFQNVSRTIDGIAEQYIQKVIDGRRGLDERKILGKSLFLAVLNTPVLSELWDNSDVKYRKTILRMVQYPFANKFYVRVQTTAEENRAYLRNDQVEDTYPTEFYRIVENDPQYLPLLEFLNERKKLPSAYYDNISKIYTILGSRHFKQDQINMADIEDLLNIENLINLENQAYEDSTQYVNKKPIKTPLSKVVNLQDIQALFTF